VLPRSLRLSLIAVQVVAALTLLRSVAYDRWITVLASALLLVGATAVQRGGRAWGIALMFAMALAFPTAFAIGIAPAWFCLVGMVAALPLMLTWRALQRFDRGAATLMATIAAGAGALGAMTWKEIAWEVFVLFPALRPSMDAQNGALVAALAAIGAIMAGAAALRRPRAATASRHEGTRHEGAGLRVAVDATRSPPWETRAAPAEADLLADVELDGDLSATRKRLRT
jgi:hypothetical protein